MHFENLEAIAERLLKCVWKFWYDIYREIASFYLKVFLKKYFFLVGSGTAAIYSSLNTKTVKNKILWN